MAARKQEQDPETDDAIAVILEVEETKWFWHGIAGAIPYDQIDCKGWTFHRFTNPPVEIRGKKGYFRSGPELIGHVAPANAEHASAIRKDIGRKVVVWPAGVGRGKAHVRSKDDPMYQPSGKAHEEPLANYLYFVEVPSRLGFDRSKEPAPLAQSA